MTTEEAPHKLRLLEWTEEVRPTHPWYRGILVNRKDVAKLIKEITSNG